MLGIKLKSWVRGFLLLFVVGLTLELAATPAEARAGRGRSVGRSSYNSRPASGPQAAPARPAAPVAPMNTPMNQNRGGSFMRSMAGGIAGGFLGSMLFSSLGKAAGGGGELGAGQGGSGGGLGLLEIALIGGLAYFTFRWWKNRQQQQQPAFATVRAAHSPQSFGSSAIDTSSFQSLQVAGIDPDVATDIFFNVQGAWTRRDFSTVSHLLDSEVRASLEQDASELKSKHQINRLENISVRRAELTNRWYDEGSEYSTVHFLANLLDYTVDEKSGQVVEGSDSLPVKFEENWTFVKSPGQSQWRLTGIEQV